MLARPRISTSPDLRTSLATGGRLGRGADRSGGWRSRSSRRRRRGFILSIELVMLLPFLFALIVGVIEMSLLELGRQHVAAAARVGARVGSMPGTTLEDIDQAVAFGMGSAALGTVRQVSVQRGPNSGDPVVVRVSVPMKAASPDLLGLIGFGLGARSLVGQAVARVE